jgi:hypothetical protein
VCDGAKQDAILEFVQPFGEEEGRHQNTLLAIHKEDKQEWWEMVKVISTFVYFF